MEITAQDLVTEAKRKVPSITCTEYLAMRKRKQPHALIDVREKDEWDAGHIDGAIHIPRGMLEFKIGEAIPDKHASIVVQCASGGRSALCGHALIKLGYTNVQSLEGGYKEYCAATKK